MLALSLAAHAQLPSGGNAFFGYSYLHGEAFSDSGATATRLGGASMNGWEVSAEGKYLPWLGVVGALDWHYGGRDVPCIGKSCTPLRVNAARDMLLFGPRASLSYGKFRPFAEFLFGVGYQSDKGAGISNSDITFATAFGGGLDYTLVRSVSFRAQVDVVRTHLFGGLQNDPRISTGLAFRF